MNNFILSSLVLLSTLNMVMPLLFDSKESRACHVSYAQGPGGDWYKNLVTVVNGHKHEEKVKVSSAEAEKAIQAQREKTDKLHKKMNADIENTHKSIADSIKKSLGKFNFDF